MPLSQHWTFFIYLMIHKKLFERLEIEPCNIDNNYTYAHPSLSNPNFDLV